MGGDTYPKNRSLAQMPPIKLHTSSSLDFYSTLIDTTLGTS